MRNSVTKIVAVGIKGVLEGIFKGDRPDDRHLNE